MDRLIARRNLCSAVGVLRCRSRAYGRRLSKMPRMRFHAGGEIAVEDLDIRSMSILPVSDCAYGA